VHLVTEFLYHWQTLIAGAAALISAIATVLHLKKQIRVAVQHREEDIKGNQKAALNSFSFKIITYVEYIDRLKRQLVSLKEQHNIQSSQDLWVVFRPGLELAISFSNIDHKDATVLAKYKRIQFLKGAIQLNREAVGLQNDLKKHVELYNLWQNKTGAFAIHEFDGDGLAAQVEQALEFWNQYSSELFLFLEENDALRGATISE